MNPAEVVIHEVESYGVCVVLHFLAKPICQSGKPAYRHTHGEVLPLDVGCADVRRVRIANDGFHIEADALGRRVAALLIVRGSAVDFVEHGVVDPCPEGVFNRIQVGAVGVGCQLNAVTDAACAILHEVPRPSTIAAPNKVADDQFGIGVDADPGPNIAPSLCFLCGSGVFLLTADKAPDFIGLHPTNFEIANV